MALKSTIYKAELSIADMDRNYYADHVLTIARHPSETEERMMIRLLAFALNANEGLAFAGGLSSSDEPDLWLRDLTGSIKKWIDVGLPEEKIVRRACGRADEVCLIAYGGSKAEIWWKAQSQALARCQNLSVHVLDPQASEQLAALANRTMRLSCNVQDGQIWFGGPDNGVSIELELRQKARI